MVEWICLPLILHDEQSAVSLACSVPCGSSSQAHMGSWVRPCLVSVRNLPRSRFATEHLPWSKRTTRASSTAPFFVAAISTGCLARSKNASTPFHLRARQSTGGETAESGLYKPRQDHKLLTLSFGDPQPAQGESTRNPTAPTFHSIAHQAENVFFFSFEATSPR